jgi:oxygen-dependent protoporphyrinogen oxidase
VTLVVDQPELDAAPRGTGMLVHPDAAGVAAKAITHATVKWPWLAEAAAGRHVLRLSYATDATDGADVATSLPVDPTDATGTRATRDATALLGVPVAPSAVVGAARVRWHGPDTTAAGLAEGVVAIGEASTGRGLAGIVASSRAAAEHILDS